METTKTSQQQSKADFVRSLPKNLSTKEVVAKAKQAGIKLGEDYVYKVRSRERAKTPKRRPRPRQARSSKGSDPEVRRVGPTLVRASRRTNLSLPGLSST